MIRLGLAALIVTYLPGALAYRLPGLARDRRAALRVEERLFWHVTISLMWSLTLVLVLAACGVYTIERLLAANALLCAVLLAGFRGRLRLGAGAAPMTGTAVLALALLALGAWRFFPQSEYLIGGKDPGTYMNEGVQLAQRGAILITDGTVAAVPAALRDLFFTPHDSPHYYDNRFMGFFLRDPDTGETVGQLPHLYPASIAIAYGLAGLDGAQQVTGLWGMLGLLAVFVMAARLVGPLPAFAAAALLGLNVAQVWWARYPNAEIAMQPLVFAGLLAFARAHQDDDPFFAPVAGWLIALLPFVRIEAAVVGGGLAAALLLMWLVDRRPPRWAFLAPASLGAALALWYYAGPMNAYFDQPLRFVQKLPAAWWAAGAAGIAAGAGCLLWLRGRATERSRRVVPAAICIVVLGLAGYALFFRVPGGKLTDYNAFALRTFTEAYFLWPALAAALVGYVAVLRRDFWRDPAFILVVTVFAVFFCYKIRIVEQHFWMSRRVLPIVLPGVVIFASAAALGRYWPGGVMARTIARAAGVGLIAVLGWQYHAIAAPVVAHTEYAGLTRYLEALAGRFSDRDLIIVESRDSGSDMHVFAAPLAYIFGKQVLVLESPVPNTEVLEAFLAHARRDYARVFFLGGGGTTLLSRRIAARPIADERVHLPEYEVTPWNTFPDEVRRKDFDYSIYELTLGAPGDEPFVLDLGYQDDLHVVRFHAKELSDGRTVRWTGPLSFISVPGLTGVERALTLVMHDGGRPRGAPPATVEIALDDVLLGVVVVGSGFRTYTVPLPAEVVQRAATREAPAQVRLRSSVWVPREILGGTDGRPLGVMIDKVEIR